VKTVITRLGAETSSLQNGQGIRLALRIRPENVLTFDTSSPG
jgi:hypothetical protein